MPPGALDSSILIPLAGHLILVLGLYLWLSTLRALNVMRGGRYSDLASPNAESGLTYRVAANLGNQFEAPALLYPLVLLLWWSGMADRVDVLLVWIFLCGRIIHTMVQTLTTNVLVRGMVFAINFGAIALLWIKFLASAL